MMAEADKREIMGFRLLPGFLGRRSQSAMVEAVREVVGAAPLVRPVTPWGRPMSVRMTSAGRLGWVICSLSCERTGAGMLTRPF